MTRAVFPGALKRYAIPLLPASTLSKARNAYPCSPVYRHDLCLLGLWAGGAPRSQAQLLVDHAQDVVDRLWPAEDADARQLSLLETEAESSVNPIQARYQGGDDQVMPGLVDGLRRQRAALSSFIASLMARSEGRTA